MPMECHVPSNGNRATRNRQTTGGRQTDRHPDSQIDRQKDRQHQGLVEPGSNHLHSNSTRIILWPVESIIHRTEGVTETQRLHSSYNKKQGSQADPSMNGKQMGPVSTIYILFHSFSSSTSSFLSSSTRLPPPFLLFLAILPVPPLLLPLPLLLPHSFPSSIFLLLLLFLQLLFLLLLLTILFLLCQGKSFQLSHSTGQYKIGQGCQYHLQLTL